MYTTAERTQQNKDQSAANSHVQRKNKLEPLSKFTNGRPEAIAQRKESLEEEPLQGKIIVQRQAMAEEEPLKEGFVLPVQKKPNNTGLPDTLKTGMENLGGYSMDDVKVHYNSARPAQLQAFAYAQGTDIHIGPGQEKHLPHEAWHVVQQKQKRVWPTIQMGGGISVNDDAGLETESDVMGARALGLGGGVTQGSESGHVQFKGCEPGETHAFAVLQLHKVVADPKHWEELDTQALFNYIPELHGIREGLIGIDVENWTWDLKARCIALVRQYPELQELIGKYIKVENNRRAQYGGMLRDLNPDDTEDHITMIAARIRWTLKVIGSGEFEDIAGPVDLPGEKRSEDVGSLVSATQDEASLGKGGDSDKGSQPGPSAPQRLVPTPRLPGKLGGRKSPEENAKELQQFEQNIAKVAKLVAEMKPAVVEKHELLINAKIAELSKTKDTNEAERTTAAYNQLPGDTAEYWKTCVAHESLMEGLELIVMNARKPKGYPVDIAKFNAIFPSLISRTPEELVVAVQSLMRLAPNKQDLMETTVEGVMRETTGFNCGKTIATGFNTALNELTPPESEVRTLCNAANKKILKDVVAVCLVKTKGRGDLPDTVRKALIERILTIAISGEGSIAALLPLVTPEAVRLILDTLHTMYNHEAIVGACKLELSTLAENLSKPGSTSVKALAQFERLSSELQLENMYKLIGDDFFVTFEFAVTPEILTQIAIKGGLLCTSSDSESGKDPAKSAKGADIVEAGTKSSYPNALGEIVTLASGLSGKDNLYFKGNNTFAGKWGFYDKEQNVIAKNKIRQILNATATEVLRLHMPPTAVQEAVSRALKSLRQIEDEYTLADAMADFVVFSTAVIVAIEIYNQEHNALQ